MAISRTKYITYEELNTILGGTTYTSADVIKIYEASELLEYHMQNLDDFDVDTAPDNLKKATAYQVQFNDNNLGNDYEYSGENNSFGIGKYNESLSAGGNGIT